ncbi:unnamed protein product [Trichogramma brassicae]|uniref:Peptidase A2 domain-containing protein n=1 Tax=Trichogramma brassicae TaxID=86971 RepID=A0A6H5ISD3_9HYME|nr:unnamed protein product [Trichogramma brassicae]
MAAGTNNGKVRTRAQVEQFKQRMEALVRLEAPSMVWAKIRELPMQAVMEKLQQRQLSISGDEETLRVRLFRARCKALPNSNQLDVPWDPETDEETEQDEKSLNETILQAKNHEMEIDQAQGGGAPPVPTEGVFTPQMIAVLTETIRHEVGIAIAQEIAKLSRGEASADAVGASAGLGLRSSPPRDSGLTPKIRKPSRKMPRKMVTVEDRDMEEVQETSTPWDSKTPLGLLPGRHHIGTLEERLGGEESSQGEKVTLEPGEDCAGGTSPRNTSRTDPASGGVTSKTAENAVCRSQTQSLVSGEYNSDEDIECLDSVYMAMPDTSMPDEQDGADSGPEEGAIVTTIAEIHEPRESERRGPTRSIIYLDIAAMTKENRFFVDVRVGPFTYKALLDSGAQCCLAGPRMMRELAERIKPSMSLIGYANQQTQPSGGYLPVMLQIDREAGRIDMECTEILPVEMVLGVDFSRRWRVDISMGRISKSVNQWRSGDGPWHNFAKLNDARSMRCDIVAECAGITVGEREIIESKIKRLIPDVPPKLGHTDKIVHRIELVEGAKPVCHRTRQTTPKMEKIAHECLQKMKEEGIIEPAKSEWNSAPVLVKKSDGSYRF